MTAARADKRRSNGLRDVSGPFTFAPVQSAARLFLYFVLILVSVPVQALFLVLRLPAATRFPMLFHRQTLRLMRAKVVVKGEQVKDGPVLFVCNHTSYIDISILGTLIRGSFVAKAEVADWPLFGWCAKLSRTVFVDRRPRYAKEQAEQLRRRLEQGDRLILFPEGTSNDGNRVLPFRSSLFGAAEMEVRGAPLTIQPISIAYTRLDGVPLGRHLRPFFAWYGDMDMISHLWQLLGIGRFTAVVEFHDPVTIKDFGSRKALATHCQRTVAAGVASALAGREQPPPTPMGRPAEPVSPAGEAAE